MTCLKVKLKSDPRTIWQTTRNSLYLLCKQQKKKKKKDLAKLISSMEMSRHDDLTLCHILVI